MNNGPITAQEAAMKKNLPVTQREVSLAEDTNILSTTDLKGAITYVNDEFIRISGFSEDELLGKNHNVVRHPDMPPAAFEHLWATLKAGRPWMGIIKNRCKNGDHYWVSAYVTPIHHADRITEYQSVRTKPSRDLVARAEAYYPHLMAGTGSWRDRLPRLGARWRLPLYLALISATLTGAGLLAGLALAPTLAALVPFSLLGMGLAWFDSRPLAQLGERSRRLAQNPLSQFVYTGRRDEFGAIEFAMKMLEAETGAAIGRVGDASKDVLGKAERLVMLVEQARAAILDQQAQTDQVATAVEQMSASVREVAQNAQHTADTAHQADGDAATGRQVVLTAGEAIAALAQGIEQAAAVIHTLEQRSDEISSVLDVIRGIAEQTNLLALNAAIEAARAGEQGRGFAVVADEVRNLASRTQSSTREIQSMIENLQAGARSSVEVMRQSRSQAEHSVAQAEAAGESLNAITRGVQGITDMSAQIATAVEEQSAVSEEIARSISSIRQAADGNAQTSAEIEQASNRLVSLAEELRTLARQFWEHRR